jgi:hypothetical protein
MKTCFPVFENKSLCQRRRNNGGCEEQDGSVVEPVWHGPIPEAHSPARGLNPSQGEQSEGGSGEKALREDRQDFLLESRKM